MRVKLSERQAAIILGAKWHTVNGVTTRRVQHIKGTPPATYEKLWRLGLIVAPHEYADLTALGASAEMLLKHNDKAKVRTDMPGGEALVYDTRPTAVARFTLDVSDSADLVEIFDAEAGHLVDSWRCGNGGYSFGRAMEQNGWKALGDGFIRDAQGRYCFDVVQMDYDTQPTEVTPEALGAALTAAEQMLDRLAQQAGPRP